MLALLGEEQRHHSVAVVPVSRRTEEQVHRLSLSDTDNAGCRIVTGMKAVLLVALVNEHGRKSFRRISDIGKGLHKVDYIVTLPAEVVGKTYSGMRTAVAHGDENIVFLQADNGLINLLAVNIQLIFGIVIVLAVAQKYNVGIVVLDEFCCLIIYQVNYRKGGVSHSPDRTDRKRCGNGRNALLKRKSLCHHR